MEKKAETGRDVQTKQVKMILETAQVEAWKWKLQNVKIWDPAPLVQELVLRVGVRHKMVIREEEGIASFLWFGHESCGDDSVQWIANEKYAWC